MANRQFSNLDLSNYEIPACTLTGRKSFIDFPWGSYHLNLTAPIRVVKCTETGLLYLCPRPNKKNRELLLQGNIPAVLREYGEQTYNYASIDQQRVPDYEKRMKLIEEIIKAASVRSILDLGCSSGNFLEIAERAGWNAVGVEPYFEDVVKCQKKQLDVIQSMAESLPFLDNTFLVVHSNHVFEHLEDPLAAAKEIFRVLKPGGLIFIEVPNQLDNFGFHRDMLFRAIQQRNRDISSIHHLWFFGRITLKSLMKQAGFKNIKIQNIFPKPVKGWRYPFSLMSQILARIRYGSYIIRGLGYKPSESD